MRPTHSLFVLLALTEACATAPAPPTLAPASELVPRHWDQACSDRGRRPVLTLAEVFDTVGLTRALADTEIRPLPLAPPWPLYEFIVRYRRDGTPDVAGTWYATVDSTVAHGLESELHRRVRRLPGLLKPTGIRARAVFARQATFDLAGPVSCMPHMVHEDDRAPTGLPEGVTTWGGSRYIAPGDTTTAIVRIVLGRDGEVERVDDERGTPGALERARSVIPALRFEPALENGVAVPGELVQAFRFPTGAVPTGALRAGLRARLDAFVEAEGIPGATLGVALDDGPSFALSAGVADTATVEWMPRSGRMLQGSVGKTYFSAVALQLVAEGVLELDRPIAEYFSAAEWLDRLPNAREVTLRQIMSHTSGIVRYETSPGFLEDLRADPFRSYLPEERLAYLFDTEAPFAAGEGWDYSDTNYILVAMLVERVTGASAYDEVRRRVLAPLGLAATVPSDRPRIDRLVQGYAGSRNPFGAFDATLDGGSLRFNPQFEWGGGGFASTAEDLAVWMRELQNGRAFPPDLLEEYREGTPAPLGPEARYGLGVIMMNLPAGRAWGHSGFMPGYRTEAYYFPDIGVALALQVNTTDPDAYREQPLQVLSDLARIAEEATEGR